MLYVSLLSLLVFLLISFRWSSFIVVRDSVFFEILLKRWLGTSPLSALAGRLTLASSFRDPSKHAILERR